MLSTTLTRVAAAAGLAFIAASASALPSFELDPSAASLSGTSFTADNVIVSDYATVALGGTSFTETGYLSVVGFQLDGAAVDAAGLNSTYGLYIAFTGTGTTDGKNPLTSVTEGDFTNLTYTLYGYNGPAAKFSAGDGTVSTTATGATALATGSLIEGGVLTKPKSGKFVPSADATLTFAAASGFFVSPSPFYGIAESTFTNTTSEVTLDRTGFYITAGGGSFNFTASPVPEPGTYALILAGLGMMATVARRRRS